MQFEHKNKGTCSQAVRFQLEENIVKNVQFFGGCHGNLQGISKLVEGMDADEVIRRLQGVRCGMKNTSCPDQLAKAIAAAKERAVK